MFVMTHCLALALTGAGEPAGSIDVSTDGWLHMRVHSGMSWMHRDRSGDPVPKRATRHRMRKRQSWTIQISTS